MTGPKVFVDTNVWVYRADESPEEQAKHDRAEAVLTENPGRLVLSTQVILEFYVTVTRRLRRPVSHDRALTAVRGMALLTVVMPDVALVLSAISITQTARISLWDALIVEAARAAGCERILTEDLSHGQVIRGVEVVDPFR